MYSTEFENVCSRMQNVSLNQNNQMRTANSNHSSDVVRCLNQRAKNQQDRSLNNRTRKTVNSGPDHKGTSLRSDNYLNKKKKVNSIPRTPISGQGFSNGKSQHTIQDFNNKKTNKVSSSVNTRNWAFCKGETSAAHINEMKTMSIFPVENDVHGNAPELAENIVKGAYSSADHYRAVQFRLLREDFIAPLREGIAEHTHSPNNNPPNKESKVFIYQNVKIPRAAIIDGGKFGHEIQLDEKVNWAEVSQLFIYGSLLLFTTNKFNTFFSGTVIDVNKGKRTVMVKLDGKHFKVCNNVCASVFTMAAFKVFFEPYFHVLTGLQNMKNENFPMENYIIRVHPNPKRPAYIVEHSPLIYMIAEKYCVNVSQLQWPNFDSLKLNSSQHRAFQAALTHEFVAIQGPPGTGKTYLARQIVYALLDNVHINTPILVVCFKNQALDQFLEGLLEKTKDIIRVGGNSQNEKLEEFNVKKYRSKYGFGGFKKHLDCLAKTYAEKQKSIDKLFKNGVLYPANASLLSTIKNELSQIEDEIRNVEQQLENARNEADLAVMQRAKVVGMTSTAAARLRPWLNKLGAKIVVFEEAAEVLESHIVAALSDKCQHVILIGDHKQLRPNAAVYELCQRFNLNISLFERMVNNGLNYYQLNVQHRMRPEFSSLIAPAIYSDLIDHSSTYDRLDIVGVHHNLYFINHQYCESQLPNMVSHINKHEANFVVHLADYLVKQGYQAKDITILATYSGQVKLIDQIKKQVSSIPSDLVVTTVDDYQGQENKIIILSLVRSNNNRRIGFLQMENRVCVALSRARDGFYIIGNMDLLAKNSKIWPKVRKSLLKCNALGNSLSVYCQCHPETVTLISFGDDFLEMPNGGCNKICGATMRCGHTCERYCHPVDRDHVRQYKCAKPCSRRICSRNHFCPKLCGEECLPCIVKVKHNSLFGPCYSYNLTIVPKANSLMKTVVLGTCRIIQMAVVKFVTWIFR